MIISIVSGYYCFHDSGLITGESVRNQLFTPRLFVRVGSIMIDYFAIQVNTAPSFVTPVFKYYKFYLSRLHVDNMPNLCFYSYDKN